MTLLQSCAQVHVWRNILNIAMFFRKIAVNGVQRIFKRFNSGQLTLENQSVQKYLHDLKNEFDLMQNSNKSHNRLQYLTPIMHYLSNFGVLILKG